MKCILRIGNWLLEIETSIIGQKARTYNAYMITIVKPSLNLDTTGNWRETIKSEIE